MSGPARYHRRGSAYVLVLALSMIVVIVGLTAAGVERLRIRSNTRQSDGADARLLARSAVEYGLHELAEISATNPDWRAALAGQKIWVFPPERGAMCWWLEEHDGDMLSASDDALPYVVGTGVVGDTRYSLRVAIRPAGTAFSCLESAIHADRQMTLGSSALVQADGDMSANERIDLSGASVYANVHSAAEIIGFPVVGTTSAFGEVHGMPSNVVFDDYLAMGTVIDAADLPVVGGECVLEGAVLSPGHNSVTGQVNSEGVYVIDPGGKNLRIRNFRLLGTLVCLSGGHGSEHTIEGSVHMTPAVRNMPTLLVKNKVRLEMSGDDLDETIIGVNFNPVGTPYGGSEDDDLDDTYPSVLHGLVFIDKDLRLAAPRARIEGCLVVDGHVTAEPSSWLEVAYDENIAEDPPLGFFVPEGVSRVGAYTWERVARDPGPVPPRPE